VGLCISSGLEIPDNSSCTVLWGVVDAVLPLSVFLVSSSAGFVFYVVLERFTFLFDFSDDDFLNSSSLGKSAPSVYSGRAFGEPTLICGI